MKIVGLGIVLVVVIATVSAHRCNCGLGEGSNPCPSKNGHGIGIRGYSKGGSRRTYYALPSDINAVSGLIEDQEKRAAELAAREAAAREAAARGNLIGPYGGPYGVPYGGPNGGPYGGPNGGPYGWPDGLYCNGRPAINDPHGSLYITEPGPNGNGSPQDRNLLSPEKILELGSTALIAPKFSPIGDLCFPNDLSSPDSVRPIITPATPGKPKCLPCNGVTPQGGGGVYVGGHATSKEGSGVYVDGHATSKGGGGVYVGGHATSKGGGGVYQAGYDNQYGGGGVYVGGYATPQGGSGFYHAGDENQYGGGGVYAGGHATAKGGGGAYYTDYANKYGGGGVYAGGHATAKGGGGAYYTDYVNKYGGGGGYQAGYDNKYRGGGGGYQTGYVNKYESGGGYQAGHETRYGGDGGGYHSDYINKYGGGGGYQTGYETRYGGDGGGYQTSYENKYGNGGGYQTGHETRYGVDGGDYQAGYENKYGGGGGFQTGYETHHKGPATAFGNGQVTLNKLTNDAGVAENNSKGTINFDAIDADTAAPSLSFEEQEKIYNGGSGGPNPAVAADPVSIALAHKKYIELLQQRAQEKEGSGHGKGKIKSESAMFFGPKTIPIDGRKPIIENDVPEEKLSSVDKPIVELKIPTIGSPQCVCSCDGPDDAEQADLERERMQQEEAANNGNSDSGDYITFGDLGYGPVGSAPSGTSSHSPVEESADKPLGAPLLDFRPGKVVFPSIAGAEANAKQAAIADKRATLAALVASEKGEDGYVSEEDNGLTTRCQEPEAIGPGSEYGYPSRGQYGYPYGHRSNPPGSGLLSKLWSVAANNCA